MRRRAVPLAEFSHEEPPQELLHFTSRASSPQWTAPDFAAWLRARAAWRDTHAEPLPSLPGRERCAIRRMDLPAALVQAEQAAPTRPPEWYARRPRPATHPTHIPADEDGDV